MKRFFVIITTLIIGFGFGWWVNDMYRFANGVREDAKNRRFDPNQPIELSITESNKIEYWSDLAYRVRSKGDIEAYKELSAKDMSNGSPGEFLSYALIMANRYNYGPAFYDVYGELSSFQSYSEIEDNDVDSITKNLMKTYLQGAIDRGVDQAQNALNKLNMVHQ